MTIEATLTRIADALEQIAKNTSPLPIEKVVRVDHADGSTTYSPESLVSAADKERMEKKLAKKAQEDKDSKPETAPTEPSKPADTDPATLDTAEAEGDAVEVLSYTEHVQPAINSLAKFSRKAAEDLLREFGAVKDDRPSGKALDEAKYGDFILAAKKVIEEGAK